MNIGVARTKPGSHEGRAILPSQQARLDCRAGMATTTAGVANGFVQGNLVILPEKLACFMRSHPLIRIDLQERSSPEIPLAVLDGRADLGIVDIAHPLQGLQFRDLFCDQLVLIVPRTHRLAQVEQAALHELLDEDFICLMDGNAISSRLMAAAARIGQTIRIRMQMYSFDAVCRMVAGGLGLGVLPLQAVAPQLAHLPIVAVALSDPWTVRTHRLVTREGVKPPAAAHSLIEALLQLSPR